MTGVVSRLRYLVASIVVVIVTATAVASACVPFATLAVRPRSSGVPGEKLIVDGFSFEDGPVELRWNSVDGPLLSSSYGPDFSAPIGIPEAAEGLYVLVALGRLPDGGVGSVARSPIYVVRMGDAANTPAPAPQSLDEKESQLPGFGSVLAIVVGIAVIMMGAFCRVATRRRRRQVDPL